MGGVTGRTGPTWERRVADHCAAAGLPWDRAILRGAHDLLDLTGTIPAGFLIGCKGIRRGTEFGQKISEAMDQCDRALLNLNHYLPGPPRQFTQDGHGHMIVESNGIIPVQIMQRSGYPTGKAYAVTQLDYLLDLAVRRQKWRDDE